MLKKNYNLFVYTAAISFIFLLLLSVIFFWSFNETFYRFEHSIIRLNNTPLSEYIGISDEQLDELTSFTLNYLKDKDTTLDKQMVIKGNLREVFNQKEKDHMIDVQALAINARNINIILLIIYACSLFIVIKNKLYNELFKAQLYIYKVFGMFLMILIAWIIIDFDSFWNYFHHIFFSGNDLWILDLNKDILIMIVPPEFFFHLVGIIVICFIILSIIYLLFLNYKRRVIYD